MKQELRVLLIEDSEDDALLLVREIQRAGYDPQYARVQNKEELLSAFGRQSWDIVFADYSMPEFSGDEALELFKERGIDIPFIFVSGAMGEDRAVECMKAGAHDYFVKGNLTRLQPVIERELREAKIRWERKEAGEQLRYQATLLANVSDAIVASDSHYQLTEWNGGAESLYGWKAEEVLGRNGLEILHTEWPGADAKEMRRTIAETGRWRGEATQTRKDGARIFVELATMVLRNKNGQITGYVSVIRDITERKRAEEELELLKHSIDGHYDGGYWMDSDNRFIYVNEAGCKALGYRREELIGMTVDKVNPRATAGAMKSLWERLRTGGFSSMESVHRRKDGSEFPVEIVSTYVRFGGKEYNCGFARDITARKHFEEALAESKALLSSIIDSTPDLIWSVDADTFALLTFNKGLEDFFNRAGIRIKKGILLKDILPAELVNKLSDLYSRTLKEGLLITEYQTTIGNRVLWIHLQVLSRGNKPYAISVFARDITERKRAERALRMSEDKFSKVFRSSPDAILVTELKHGTIEEVNTSFVKLSGYSRDELIGHTVLELNLYEEASRQQFLAMLSEHHLIRHVEFGLKNRAGQEILVVASAELIEIDEVPHVITTLQDITARKRTEKELSVNEQKYRSIFENIQDVYYEATMDGTLLEVSPSIEIVSRGQYHRNDLIGKLLYDFYPDVRERHALVSALKEKGSVTEFEVTLKNRDGSLIPCSVTAKVLLNAQGNPEKIIGNVHDISRRKQAEKENSTLAFALRSINECVSITDMDDTILFVNASFLETYGYSENELLGKNMSIVRSPKDSQDTTGNILPSTVAGGWHGEMWNRRKDGTEFPISLSTTAVRDNLGQPIALIGIAIDIAERKRSEEALRKSEDQYRTLFDESLNVVFISTPDGKLTEINPAGVKLFGYGSKEEMLTAAVAQDLFMNPDDRRQYQASIDEKGFVKDYEIECKTKDGKLLNILETANAVRDAFGNVVAYRGIMRDITVQKRLEKEFLRAQRMESIGTLAGGVAHDLNNVLAPIMMAVEILQAKFSDEEGKRILETLATSTRRGSDIVKQILAFGRGIEGHRIIIQPKHVIREVEKISAETFPKSIQVKTIIPKDLWTILADPTQFHQVLLNVCVNARDAMPRGGTLTIAAENVSLDEYFSTMHAQAKPGPHVVVTITDTGTGIPPEVLEHIFDPFFTTKEVGKGTGLGLSTALGIVKAHGGFIDVYSEPGRGTFFRIYFPAQMGEQGAAKETERPELPRGKGELILVVDDEASIREIARLTLEVNGYRVVTASDGVEAVSVCARDKGEIGLILIDMMMPGMDGPTTIRALQMMKIGAKIVGTSGHTERESMSSDSIPGMQAFLQKPYTAEALLHLLYDVLNNEQPSEGNRV